MNALMLGILQCLGSYINIFRHRACQGAYRGPCHRFRYLDNRVEITGAGNRKAGFDHIHPQSLQLAGYLNLFHRIQLATGHLLSVAQRGVENK